MKPITDKSLSDFFEFHRARVTNEDIRDMVPSDPGYGGYVRFLEKIRETGLLPDCFDGNLWEVVAAPPIGPKNPPPSPEAERFQESMVRYRNFVFSIALGTIDTVEPSGEWFWHTPICWLLEDADRGDRAYLRLFRAALKTAGEKMVGVETLEEFDHLFFTLAVFFANGWLKDHHGMAEAARQLIKEDREFRAQWCRGGTGFVWDLVQLRGKHLASLRKLVSGLENPKNDFDIECVLRFLQQP